MFSYGKYVIRERLADSHVAAIAVAVLLMLSLDLGFRAAWTPLSEVLQYLATAILIFDIPYFSFISDSRLILLNTSLYLVAAACNFVVAWLISRFVYGTGPLETLSLYRAKLQRRKVA